MKIDKILKLLKKNDFRIEMFMADELHVMFGWNFLCKIYDGAIIWNEQVFNHYKALFRVCHEL